MVAVRSANLVFKIRERGARFPSLFWACAGHNCACHATATLNFKKKKNNCLRWQSWDANVRVPHDPKVKTGQKSRTLCGFFSLSRILSHQISERTATLREWHETQELAKRKF
eukprot:Phypoly_transcript_20349.p1 GENE.Phypoly_transcript_20349~~Phypoly_transcript_20349.p1  ORF type:complete len:112 (-),score=10.62 Phypoly_transcript_20349:13-348(-)